MRRVGLFLCIVLLASACASVTPDDCSLRFRGHSRKDVKIRGTSQPGYEHVTATVNSLLQMGCDLQSQLPSTIPEDAAMDAEKREVTLHGFLHAVRFERLGPFMDQDFHIQLSDSPDWNASNHIVVEVPPGEVYCDARKKIWQLVKNEAGPDFRGRTHIFRTAPEVEVVGFLFYDGLHANRQDCRSNGGRGIKDGSHPNMVQGVWELHPVIAVRTP